MFEIDILRSSPSTGVFLMSDVVSAGARSRARCPVTRSRATRCLDGEKERPSGPHMHELAVRLPGEGEARTVSKMHRRRYRSATRIPSAAPPYRPKAVLREKSPSQSDMSDSHHPSPAVQSHLRIRPFAGSEGAETGCRSTFRTHTRSTSGPSICVCGLSPWSS